MDEVKKEIQSLKRKTLFLEVISVALFCTMLSTNYFHLRQYSEIQSSYQVFLESNRNLNQTLEELLSTLQAE